VCDLETSRIGAPYICDISSLGFNWHQYCNFNEAQTASIPDDSLVKPKNVGAFIVYFNVNFNILKQIGWALVGLIKDWITPECAVQLWKLRRSPTLH